MRKKNLTQLLPGILIPLAVVALLICFLSSLSNLTQGHSQESKHRLESVLREAAVACYAVEGIYPPNLAYLEEHYGVQVDRERYTVMYEVFASNLMPDITVLEND